MDLFVLIVSMLTDIGLVAIIFVITWFILRKFKPERMHLLAFIFTFLLFLILDLLVKATVLNLTSHSLDLLIVVGVAYLLRDKELPSKAEVKG